ncbi:hypothetical protein [Umezakia ovalisporum]|uniref:hypothetical protein n=1 Tax=Umezakia ovalisporum TaxID=75695 RepID=UPI0035B9C56C
MNYCPCCSGLLLPHVRASGFAWFCRHCWQDMPVYNRVNSSLLEEVFVQKIAEKIENRHQHRTRNVECRYKTLHS